MYLQSKTKNFIDSLILVDKIENDCEFFIKESSNKLRDLVSVKRKHDVFNRDFMNILYNDSSIIIKFELDKILDNNLIVDLISYYEFLILKNIDVKKYVYDDDSFYFSLEFNDVKNFDMFFEKIVKNSFLQESLF